MSLPLLDDLAVWAELSRVSDSAAGASGIGVAARAACICPVVSQRQAPVEVPSSSRVSRVWDRPGWAAIAARPPASG